MTREEIKKRLFKLRYEGGWPYGKIAKEALLSKQTIQKAFTGEMSEVTQVRLSAVLLVIKDQYDKPERKGKPGHMKRYMHRYLNLRKWYQDLIAVAGMNPRHKLQIRYKMRNPEQAGGVCTRLDYMCKDRLLSLFKDRMEKDNISFGDCYAFEQWVKWAREKYPNVHRDLLKRLTERRMTKK